MGGYFFVHIVVFVFILFFGILFFRFDFFYLYCGLFCLVLVNGLEL